MSEQIQIELLLPKLHLIHSPVNRLPSFILAGNTSNYGTHKDNNYLGTQPNVHGECWSWYRVTTRQKGEIFVSRVNMAQL